MNYSSRIIVLIIYLILNTITNLKYVKGYQHHHESNNNENNNVVIIKKNGLQKDKLNNHFRKALSLMSEEILMKKIENKLENGINKGGLGKLMTAPILKQKIDNVINHKSITNINNNQIHHTKMNNAYSVTPEQEVVISQSGEDNNKNDNMKRAGTIRGSDDSSQESKKVVIISNGDV